MTGLEANDLVVRFGGLTAVDGVSLTAPRGQITALIGPNGAGKTTLFNVCSGFQAPTEGQVVVDAVDVTGFSPSRRARLGVGRTFQRLELFRSLSVRGNVQLAVESLHIGDDPLTQLGVRARGRRFRGEIRDRADEILELVGLTGVAHRRAAELSTGHGRLLELGRTLARRPTLLLLDEPSSGLDRHETDAFGRLLETIVADHGIGILLVEHDMELVLAISRWVYVLEFGRLLTEGTPGEIRTNEAVRDAYLGALSAAAAAGAHPPAP